jgi:hypothetical protein
MTVFPFAILTARSYLSEPFLTATRLSIFRMVRYFASSFPELIEENSWMEVQAYSLPESEESRFQDWRPEHKSMYEDVFIPFRL